MKVDGIVKELVYTGCYLRTYVFKTLQTFRRIVGQVLQVADGCRQDLGRGLPDITDPQSEDQPVQRLLPGSLYRRLQIADAFFSKAFQFPDLIVRKTIDARNILQKPKLIE